MDLFSWNGNYFFASNTHRKLMRNLFGRLIFISIFAEKIKHLMKTLSAILLTIILVPQMFSQNAPLRCNFEASEAGKLKQNGVFEQWEYKVDKKTKQKMFNSVCEFDENGCMVKHIVPLTTGANRTYGFYQWKYDGQGRLLTYAEGGIDNDSAKTFLFSENYSYNSTGLVSNYRKEIYEGLMSQTVIKWNYSYSANGEKSEISFSKLIARKDTIVNDDIRYSGTGAPVERVLNSFSPKGFSEYGKYNEKGLPVEYIRYEKGQIVSHKMYAYVYDKQGSLMEENATDGVGKTNEKKKYDKDKVTYTIMSSKGKVLKSTVEPYAPPRAISFPPLPALSKSAETTSQGGDKTTEKEKLDKKKNKIIEHYNAQKLVSTDTYNSKGLLIEKNVVDSGFALQYDYTLY